MAGGHRRVRTDTNDHTMTEGVTIPQRFPADRPLEDDLGLWWVLHAKPNCERMVASFLMHRDIGYYLPLYKRSVKVGYYQRVRTKEVPLFRGYLCFALEKPRHGLLYDSKKVVRIIEVQDQWRFVTELQAVARAIAMGDDLLVEPRLIPGKRARILSGPLEGVEGVIVKGRKEKQFALSVVMFNQSVIVRVDPLTIIEPA
jgi:transcription antitermination factor NusG